MTAAATCTHWAPGRWVIPLFGPVARMERPKEVFPHNIVIFFKVHPHTAHKSQALVRQHHDTPEFLVRGRAGGVRGAAYLDAMHTSVFCVAAPGSGWGIRAYHALLHGCMPVFIPGDVDGPALDDVLPWSRFSLKVANADLPNLPAILRALPEKRVRAEALRVY